MMAFVFSDDYLPVLKTGQIKSAGSNKENHVCQNHGCQTYISREYKQHKNIILPGLSHFNPNTISADSLALLGVDKNDKQFLKYRSKAVLKTTNSF